MKPIQKAMTHIFDRVAEKQFYDLQRNKAYYDALILTTPSGKEKQMFQVGDSVISNFWKNKPVMIVTEVYEQNGYWYYICGQGKKNKKTGWYKFVSTERQKDLVKA
jgi:hypothetical protein